MCFIHNTGKCTVSFIILFLFTEILVAQDDPLITEQYDFIRYEKNRIEFLNDSSAFEKLFILFNRLVLTGEGQINMIHIGDSHIQADYFSGRIRERLQTFIQGGVGGRGFIFPYPLAGTNNPASYSVSYTGKWENCKNVSKYKVCELSLSGISATTYDSIASITIRLRNKDAPKYDFNRIKVFHEMDSSVFSVETDGYVIKKKNISEDTLPYTLFAMKEYTDSLHLRIIKTDTVQDHFTLHGISIENDDPGIIYHSIGVNGAEAGSYLKCSLLCPHLRALKADCIIISLGVNDACASEYSRHLFECRMDSLLRRIRMAAPDVPILLTVPGDSYKRKYINKKIPEVRESIYNVAEKYHCAVWDLFSIMGGLNSVLAWQAAGMTAPDRLHFNKKGYVLQGDLFFTAFLNAYDQFIEK